MQQFVVQESSVKDKVKDHVGLQGTSCILFCDFFYPSCELGLFISSNIHRIAMKTHTDKKESAQSGVILSTKMFSYSICIFHNNVFVLQIASYCLKCVSTNLIFLNIQQQLLIFSQGFVGFVCLFEINPHVVLGQQIFHHWIFFVSVQMQSQFLESQYPFSSLFTSTFVVSVDITYQLTAQQGNRNKM